MSEIECQLCRNHFKMDQVMKANLLEEPIVQMIREKHPEWSSEGYICLPDLYLFRSSLRDRDPQNIQPGDL